jgi:predicted RNA-binding protein with PIN domain
MSPDHPLDGFLRGALEALLLPLAFSALGLAWWGTALRAEGAPPTYPRALMEEVATTTPESPVWLVDGFNVVQVGLLGGKDRSRWWSGPRRAQLLAHAAAFEPAEADVWVVFDGGSPRTEPGAAGRARVVFTPSADEWLVMRVRSAEDPGRIVVVTADRRLAGRVRHLGARVASPAEFLGRCTSAEGRGDSTPI